MQGVLRYQVRLLPYDAQWHTEYLELERQLRSLLGDQVLDVQHIGSTAIPHIWAKPILDAAVVLRSLAELDVKVMTDAGYDACGLQKPDNDRYLFVLRGENELSLRHIHCYEPDNPDYLRCIRFRDYLIAHPESARAYSELKQRLAEQYPHDRVAYAAAKQDFILSVYDKCM